MPTHSQFQPDEKRQHIDYINQRWSQLYHLEKEWADKAVNFLFLTNSGGAIAMLGFIGTKQHVHVAVVVGLGIMLFGLVLVGFLVAHVYSYMGALFKAWRKDADEYFLDQIAWDKLIRDDKDRCKNPTVDLWLGYGSLGCFIVGIALGISGLLIGK